MLLIRNGTIIDGTGKPAYKGDIFVTGGRISAIGAFPNKKADTVIDALGLTVTPGFIDVNNDSDHHLALFTNPGQSDFLAQGVTTIIGGHCGASLAPLLYGSLESVRKWANPDEVNVNWRWLPEFFRTLGMQKLGVNFGTLVGHSTIRRAIIGEDLRDLTDNELAVLKSIVWRSMSEGALGLSTGLGFAHGKQVPFREIRELAAIVAHYGRVYSTHLRDEEDGVSASVEETIRIATETKAKTLISHFRPLLGFESAYQKALALIRATPRAVDLHVDLYPFAESHIPIYMLLPEWARKGNLERMRAALDRAHIRDEVVRSFKHIPLAGIRVAKAAGFPHLVGKTIGETAKNLDTTPEEALFRLMRETRMKALVLIRNINLPMTEEMLFEPRALVATNSASVRAASDALLPERATKTFPRYLELALKRNVPLEHAVQKLTATPAKKFGLAGRGVLKQGSYADIVCLEGTRAVHVTVGGALALQGGVPSGVRAGTIIRSSR